MDYMEAFIYISEYLKGEGFWDISPEKRLGGYDDGIGLDSLELAELTLAAENEFDVVLKDFTSEMRLADAARYLAENVKA